jgi:Xaa-Pro aminopeptidase
MFSPNFFKNNRKRLLEKTKADLIVLTASGLVQSSNDETHPFIQDSNFWYLTGVQEPDIVAVFSGAEEFLIVPNRDKIRIIFEGDVNKAELAKISGINKVMDEREGWKRLRQLLKKSVATVAPPAAYIRRAGFYTNPARARLIKRLKNGRNGFEITDLRSELAEMRMYKQEPEVRAISKSLDIAIKSFKDVLSRRKDFEYEYQVEAAMNCNFRYFGGEGPSFATIAASGKNACILHYREHKNKLKREELLLIDAGTSFSHYASDLTRTIALRPPSERQQAVYDAVLSIQKYAFGLIKPGLSFKDYHLAIDKFSAEKLKELGLIKKKDDDQKLRKYCPHGVSHFLGLDVHDVADYRPKKKVSEGTNRTAAFNEFRFQPGIVLTVEPGIYIPEEGIGIRIEDNILVTNDGNEVLSAGLSKGLY